MALRYPDHFKTVLAVTFTNKATEEMKSRILETLEQLAKGHHSMADDLMKALNISNSQLATRADRLLKSILHNYSFFAVTTIDAFFQKVVRSFAREIGIQTGFKVELDQQKVVSEVIDQMLADMAGDTQLIQWLTDFAIYQINQGKSWDTRREIKNLSSELFKEFLVLNKSRIFSQLNQPDFIKNFIQSLTNRQEDLRSGMAAIGEKIKSVLDNHGVSTGDFSYKAAGVGGYIDKVFDAKMIEPGKRVFDALEQGKWYSKGAQSEAAIDRALAAGLADHLSSAVDYYYRNNSEFQSLNQVVKYIYTFGLLSRISEEINDYRESNDLLLISDFPVFLNEIINDSDAPYIYEKVGTRYNHYLIDEFQDTSGLQWNNFKPLIQDTLSAGNFSMVVGDIKQSIYRWRGGNWKILLEQIRNDIGEENIQDRGLDTNRRSKQNIVEFNNDLFDHIPQFLESYLNNQLGVANVGSLNMTAAYEGSRQQLFDESDDGLIDIHFFEKGEIEDPEAYVISNLVRQLQQLQDANYQLNDIAILVRTNTQGRKIARGLMEYKLAAGVDGYKYDVISNESLFIKNNPAVHVIIQSLTWLVTPSQPLAITQLKYAIDQYSDHRKKADFDGEDFFGRVAGLSKMSMSQIVETIISHFKMFNVQQDHAYVLAFQDLILDYLKYEKDSLSDFLEWWNDHDTRSIQVSDDQDAIRLMTVHKSKGLQFKVVVVPYCQWSLDHSSTSEQLLWCQTQGSEVLEQVPYVPVRYKSDLSKSIFAQNFYIEKSDIYLDNLNLLYVALTRAEEALFLMTHINTKTKGISHVGDVIYNYCKEKDLLTEGSDSIQIGRLPEFSSYDRELRNQTALPNLDFEPPEDRIKLRQKAHILEEAVVESINYGQIIHWVFSLIRSRQDFALALDKAKVKFGLTEQEMVDIKLKLREIWDMPEVGGWYDESWEVKNESSILLTNGKLKRPDRVIVKDLKAIVIDYKTGARNDGHLKQVQEYKSILSQMGYQQIDGYLIYLSEPGLIAV